MRNHTEYLESLSKMSPGEVLDPGVVVGSAEHDDGTGVELVVGPVHHGLVALTIQPHLQVLAEPDNSKLESFGLTEMEN